MYSYSSMSAGNGQGIVGVLATNDDLTGHVTTVAQRLGRETRTLASPEALAAPEFSAGKGCFVVESDAGSAMEVLRRSNGSTPTAPIIFVTSGASVSEAIELVEHGALTVLDQPVVPNKLESAIRRAFETRRPGDVFSERFRELDRHVAQLSSREHRVLQQIAAGQLNKVIAGALQVSVRTVESDRARVVEKLGAQTTGEAVAKYAQHQVLSDLGYQADRS